MQIPGYKEDLRIQHLVIDFNGTLAIEGKLIDGVKKLLDRISQKLQVHVLTSDSYGTVAGELKDMPCKITVVEPHHQDFQKGKYVAELGKDNVICIGNGSNDRSMLKLCAIGIAVIQNEGAATDSLTSADIVCLSVHQALNLMEHPEMLVATLES